MAHEENGDGGGEKLVQADRDEDRVAAAEVEPVRTKEAEHKAGMR